MKKMVLRAYGIAAILILFLLLYGLLNLRLNTYRKTALTGYGEITDYELMTVEDEAAPLGKKQVIQFRLQNVRSDFDTLLFKTVCQEVAVYLDGEKVYQLERRPGSFLPKSPGVLYNEVVFRDQDNGKWVRIELSPVYKSVGVVPDMMLGNGYQIIKVILVVNLPILLLCLSVILIGCLQIATALLRGKQEEHMDIALTHSTFSIVIGLWKILDSDFVALFGKTLPVLSLIPYVIFMFLPIMLTKFVRDTLGVSKSVTWQIPEVATLIGIAACLVLQFLGIADFHESTWITAGCLLVTFLCMFAGVFLYAGDHGWNGAAKKGLGSVGLSLMWAAVDLYTFYATTGVTRFPFSMLLFLMFLLISGANRIRASKKGMEVGMQARQYKKLAYHDALTGFFNRAAYVDFLNSSEFNPRKSVIVAFDLNNLKKCNDELGHDKGDVYVKESAKIIMDCFGERGRCYRLGGDEFGAILMDDDVIGCAGRVRKMNERVERFNLESNDIHMGIACGYAIFDPQEDEDIHGTIRRADKMMYEEKFRMKQEARA